MREASSAGGLDAVFQEVEERLGRTGGSRALGILGCVSWLTKASLGLMEQKFMIKLQL